MNEVLKAIQDRRSTRGFNDVQLTEEQIQALMDAALASPTARNTQMWHFSFVQNQELLGEFNAELAAIMKNDPNEFNVFYHAPTVIFISRPAQCDNSFVEVDCGIACENIVLAAQGMGLGSVIVGLPKMLFQSERGEYYNRAFGFPEEYQFSIGIVVGNNTVTKDAHPIGENKISVIR